MATAAPNPDVAATVVVFNDQDKDSAALAKYYVEKRGIAPDHVIGLSCSLGESISREDYDKTIAEPLHKIFRERGWWKTEADLENGRVAESKIRFVALMRGMPLKIAATANYPDDRPLTSVPKLNHNEAAVDSELATLGLSTHQISGMLMNPYFRGDKPLADSGIPAGWTQRNR